MEKKMKRFLYDRVDDRQSLRSAYKWMQRYPVCHTFDEEREKGRVKKLIRLYHKRQSEERTWFHFWDKRNGNFVFRHQMPRYITTLDGAEIFYKEMFYQPEREDKEFYTSYYHIGKLNGRYVYYEASKRKED